MKQKTFYHSNHSKTTWATQKSKVIQQSKREKQPWLRPCSFSSTKATSLGFFVAFSPAEFRCGCETLLERLLERLLLSWLSDITL